MMKPRIFIGSSTEGLEVANKVKEYFRADYDCYLWSDDLFKNNDSFLETLMKSASLFDFGFMVFSADDYTIVRDKHFEQARDNVLFEYGLFLGRVGTDRAYIIAQEGVKIPTDLYGITHTTYKIMTNEKGDSILDQDSLNEGLCKLKKEIDENVQLGHLGLLPSTAIAISYFEGFVKLAAEWLTDNIPGEIDGVYYKNSVLKIKMPENLDSDIKRSAYIYYKSLGLQDTTINVKQRAYPVHFVGREADNTLEIYDMPTILSGLDKSIDMYFRVGHIGKKIEQQLAEENEMNNFRRVLQLLIKENADCRQCVEII